MNKISHQTAEHYFWGEKCEGWHLVKTDGLSVIRERMPPNTAEVHHYHEHARQFFYILLGRATMEVDGVIYTLHEDEGMEIPPQTPHQIRNESEDDVIFLVVSQPKSHGDRITVAEG